MEHDAHGKEEKHIHGLVGKPETGRPRPLTLFNPIFLPPAYSAVLIYFGGERGWWITCNYSFKREKQKQKEYNLRYLLAKVHTT
jgi:hypothetical protein